MSSKDELIQAVKMDVGGVYLVDNLASDCDQDALDNAFVMACYLGKPAIMAILDFHGANPRYQNDLPLRMTCRSPSHSPEVAQALLALGADPNTGEGGPLYAVATAGHVGTAQALLEAGAQHTFPGNPALPPACVGGHLPVTRLLIEAGADPEIGLQALATDAMKKAFQEGVAIGPHGLKVAGHQLETLYFLKGQMMPTLWDHLS